MTQDKIQIELTAKIAEDMLRVPYASTHDSVLFAFLKEAEPQIRAQLRPDQSLRLKVLCGNWFPKNDEHELFYIVYKSDGRIDGSYKTHSGSSDKFYFAPTPELAQELSDVILGKYRPTQADIDNETPFFVFNENLYKLGHQYSIENYPIQNIQNVKDKLRYFFTEAQLTNFIQSHRDVEKAKEPENRENRFLGYIKIKTVSHEEKHMNVYEDKDGYLTSCPY